MSEVYTQDFIVRYSECDSQDQLKLKSIFDYFQEAAGIHAGRMGFGWRWMLDNNMVWVLSRIRLRINRCPHHGERLTVKTYPSGAQRLFALRQFQLIDEDGRNAVEASSWWLVISADKNRPMKLLSLGREIPENPDEQVFFDQTTDFPKVELPGLFFTDVRYSAVDINRHLNNAEYAGFTQDALELLDPSAGLPHEIQINYLAAQVLGAKIKVGGVKDSSGVFNIEGQNETGIICFQAHGLVDATN